LVSGTLDSINGAVLDVDVVGAVVEPPIASCANDSDSNPIDAAAATVKIASG
jgi:hypothetical protein